MQPQNINIFSTGGFIFFLLIILVGYLFVEIIFGENYPFRKIFDRYKNSLFDRFIHYFLWGAFINIGTFLVLSKSSGSKYFQDIITNSGNFANSLQPMIGKENLLDTQLILLSISHFFLLFLLGLIVMIIKFIGILISKDTKIKEKTIFQKIKYLFIKK